MKTYNLVFATVSLIALTIIRPDKVWSQEIHHGESFVLEQSLNAERSHEYIANDFIILEKGFLSEPNGSNSTSLHIDPYDVFPSDEGITTSDGCVVGSLGGTVNIGALGAACYTIPISIPVGINGMQPNLGVSYNSQMGNGLLGWGWNLDGVSSIQRANNTRYHDGDIKAINFKDDQYTLDGQRLIRIEGEAKENCYEYKTEKDELSKIIAYTRRISFGGIMPHLFRETVTHFIVWTTDGKKIEYGCSDDSKIFLQESEDVCLWLVNRVEDRDGNYMEYHYDKNIYGYKLRSITYTGNDIISPELAPFCEVSFNYDNRLDNEITTFGPDIMKHPDLLKSIVISKRNVTEQTFKELYHYDFEYYDVDRTNGYPFTRLHKIHYYCGDQKYQPIFIVWPSFTNPIELTHKAISIPGHDEAFAQAVKFPGDFNGDGFTDVIVTRPSETGGNEFTEAEVYLNKYGNGGIQFEFVESFDLGDNADWIHTGDFNGDGRDDFLIVNKKRRNPPFRDQLYITVHLSDTDTEGSLVFRSLPTLGPYKINRRFRESMESVIIGDFFAKGYDGIILQSSEMDEDPNSVFQFDNAHYFECAPDGQSLIEHQLDEYMPTYRLFPADFDGNGATEIMYLTEEGCFLNKLYISDDEYHYNVFQFDQTINNQYECFTGDFNGDGKVDVFSYHLNENNNAVWQVHLSNGKAFSRHYLVEDFHSQYLDPNYAFSLQEMHHTSNFVKVADFNGDGYADVKYPKNNDPYNQHYYFGPIVENGPFAPFSRAKELYCYGSQSDNYTPNDNTETCLGLFVGKESCDDLGRYCVSKMMPNSERYNVDRIVDELNNSTEFEYGYLMPNRGTPTDNDFYQLDNEASDLSKHVLTIGVPIKAIKKLTTYNVRNRPVSVHYQYKGLMYHQWGKGILGFTGIKTVNSININDTGSQHDEILGSAEKRYNLTGYAPFIYLAPSSAKTYDKDGFMLSETTYENVAYKNVISRNQKTFFPVVTKSITDEYDIDNRCFLRKSIAETSYYHDGGNKKYKKIVRPNNAIQGVTSNPNIETVSECEFLSFEEIQYLSDEFGSWLINRPYLIATRNKKGDDISVGNCIKYFFFTEEDRHHRVKYVNSIPNSPTTGPNLYDPLATTIEYSYDDFGRIKTETLFAPNDNTLPELTNTIEYGPQYDYRLQTRAINADGDITKYTYDDDYDFCTSITDLNGQVTQYIQDPLGLTKRTVFPDGTVSCQAIRWENPSYTLGNYSIWRKTTGNAPTKEYIEKTGKTYKTESKDFSGRDVVSETEFDQYGRIWHTTLPHLVDETTEKVSYEYDAHHRLHITTNPDGTKQEIIYNGLETTVKDIATDNTELCTTTLSDIVGWTSTVTDASNSTVEYDYYPDGKLHWVRVNSSENVQNEFQYDHLGNLIWHKDPDYGISTSLYNAYGQLKRQENPRGFVSVFDYDILGRLVTKETKDGNDQIVETTVWDYSEEEGQKGTLSSINYNYGQQTIDYTYDEYLRVNSVNKHIYDDNCNYVTSYTYDPASRIASTTYPTGITTTCHYNNRGYLTTIEEGNYGVVWHTDEINEKGLLKNFTLGNGLVTEYDYYPETDLLKSIQTKKGHGFIQNLYYSYDDFHNLAARTDNKRHLTESFTYDDTNRLTGISLNEVPTGLSSYDVFGRMTSKTNDGELVFATDQNSFNPTNKPHALRAALTNQGVFPEETQSIEYTLFDKVCHISEGENTLSYDYGFDHQRIKMTETVNGISRQKLYLDNCEVITTDNSRKELTFISGPIGVFAVVETNGNTSAIHYIHKDHLGSWTTITNGNAQVEQEASFDAWGNLRDPDTWTGETTNQLMFDRGFTGHEHLRSFGLINMNGRVYDPMVSSFLSVDAFVDEPTCAQGFNRYAYCMYNPLKYVDPSGWQKVGGMRPRNEFHDDWSNSHVVPVHGTSDFTNAYYLSNLSLYGNFDGPCGGSGYTIADLVNTYGYHATHFCNSVYNYSFPITQVQLIKNWWKNPCLTTNRDLRESAIKNLTIGVVNMGNGICNAYLQWEISGKTHNAEILNEISFDNDNDCYGLSNQPLWMYENSDLKIAGGLLSAGSLFSSLQSSLYYNEALGFWRGKNGQFLKMNFNGNQYTGGKIKYGEALSNSFKKASGWINVIGMGISLVQCSTADNIDDRIKYGADVIVGGVGFVPGGTCISAFWFLGGRELVFYNGTIMTEMMQYGINPGYMEYQPFK